ncbi:MAG: binding-protein-dependent transport system inner rane component, partial [Paenibacillaceae bacterium]|nr:binding-protein-dependent transport system inner rane component [Paenibacillaceae bacterium]
MRVLWREVVNDRLAIGSLIVLLLLLAIVYAAPLLLDREAIDRVDLLAIYEPPSALHWLGTDDGGRDIFGQLLIGAGNSFSIGLAVTLLTGIVGLMVGSAAGYFGGIVDQIVMRFIDFMLILPFLMLIIVFVSITPTFNATTFVLLMSAFLWTGKARLIRAKMLAE